MYSILLTPLLLILQVSIDSGMVVGISSGQLWCCAVHLILYIMLYVIVLYYNTYYIIGYMVLYFQFWCCAVHLILYMIIQNTNSLNEI